MRKMKLDVGELDVESFDTAAEKDGRGTVVAHATVRRDECGPSLALPCPTDDCTETCTTRWTKCDCNTLEWTCYVNSTCYDTCNTGICICI